MLAETLIQGLEAASGFSAPLYWTLKCFCLLWKRVQASLFLQQCDHLQLWWHSNFLTAADKPTLVSRLMVSCFFCSQISLELKLSAGESCWQVWHAVLGRQLPKRSSFVLLRRQWDLHYSNYSVQLLSSFFFFFLSPAQYNADKAIVDSGTTLLRLPEKVFSAVVQAIARTSLVR